jgi:hypothetical protein
MLTINGTVAVTITGLTVRDGKANYGGDVYVHQGSATLSLLAMGVWGWRQSEGWF